MKRILLLLALAPLLSGTSITWVNDGGDGWDDGVGETVAAADMNAIKTAVDDNDSRLNAILSTDACTTPPCDFTSGTTLGGASIATGAHFTPDTDPGVDHSGYVAGHGDGANCSAGSFPLGVDAAGAAQGCTDGATQTELDSHAGDSTAHHTPRWIESALISETDTYTSHYAQMRVPVAVASLDISCSLAAGDGVDLDVEDRGTPNTSGSSIVSGTCTCDTTDIVTCSLSQTTLGAGRFLSFSLANAASTDDGLRIHVSATY